jgi:uncharacterized protein (DUF2235 family)
VSREISNTPPSQTAKDVESEDKQASKTTNAQTGIPTPPVDGEPSSERLCEHFKKTLSRDGVKVHFVGAWSVFELIHANVVPHAIDRDTVSSVGIVRGPTLPETTTGMTHVCAFRHALALDELRVKFLPEYANGGEGPRYKSEKAVGNVKEVWFAGSHSDM